MELQYESTIEDISEPQIRYYLRSRTYQRQRWLEPMWGGVGAIFGLYFIAFITHNDTREWWIYLIAFAFGWLCIFVTIRNTVSKRIHRNFKRELANKLPSTTKYSILGSKLQCNSMGADITFDLKDLSGIVEDSVFLELTFGDIGLCVIPLRVFRDDDHKGLFLKSLKIEEGSDGKPC